MMNAVVAPRRAVPARPRRVLVVDDDRAMVGIVTLLLGEAGYEVATAYDGTTAVRRVREDRPDLVILDLEMPGMNGEEVVRLLAAEAPTPIIMLSGRTDTDVKARVLDMGADDYLTKPVGRKELIARVRAVLRRFGDLRRSPSGRIVLGRLELDPRRFSAKIDGQDLHLTALEVRLLARLALEPDQLVTIPALLAAGWPEIPDPDPSWLRGPFHRLRAKLAEVAPTLVIENTRGVGYRLAVPADGSFDTGSVNANTEPFSAGLA